MDDNQSDQIRSDQIRSDQIRSDQIRSDQINGICHDDSVKVHSDINEELEVSETHRYVTVFIHTTVRCLYVKYGYTSCIIHE